MAQIFQNMVLGSIKFESISLFTIIWVQLIFSSLLQHQLSNIQGIYDLLSEVFKLQHHK
jgi:hypothetical protein